MSLSGPEINNASINVRFLSTASDPVVTFSVEDSADDDDDVGKSTNSKNGNVQGWKAGREAISQPKLAVVTSDAVESFVAEGDDLVRNGVHGLFGYCLQ